jgi:hypothetical protein
VKHPEKPDSSVYITRKEKMELIFKTTIKNEREKEAVVLYERNGSTMGFLMPGEERILETWNPETIYSRWTAVTFVEGGEVRLVESPDWPRPDGRWLLEALNVEGRAVEYRIIGGREVILPRGIPRLCPLDLDDRMIGYARMEIRQVLERQESSLFPGYQVKRQVIQDIFIDRSPEELQEQLQEMERAIAINEEVEHVL